MKFTIKNEEIQSINEAKGPSFPKYTTQLMNMANQTAHGTRPHVVGQLSDLFPEFMKSCASMSVEAWRKWYAKDHPDTIEKATDKVYQQVEKLKETIRQIDREMVEKWVEDLVIYKTYNGLYVQKAILSHLAKKQGTTYRLATPEEEAKGIDGFVGDTPYSVKPDTYQAMGGLPEEIPVKMIRYTKTKEGLKIHMED